LNDLEHIIHYTVNSPPKDVTYFFFHEVVKAIPLSVERQNVRVIRLDLDEKLTV
jgi:hypothetical protein